MSTLPVSSIVSPDGTPESKIDQDHKRERDQRHKYALGVIDDGLRVKPGRPCSQKARRQDRCTNDKYHDMEGLSKVRTKRSVWIHSELNSSFSSQEEYQDLTTPIIGTVPDADVTYTFDASHGPSEGSGILNLAINQAVVRFESEATERLVKAEYEVVRKDKEAEARISGYAADEDDYELL